MSELNQLHEACLIKGSQRRRGEAKRTYISIDGQDSQEKVAICIITRACLVGCRIMEKHYLKVLSTRKGVAKAKTISMGLLWDKLCGSFYNLADSFSAFYKGVLNDRLL